VSTVDDLETRPTVLTRERGLDHEADTSIS
jgi:hypothetical protein